MNIYIVLQKLCLGLNGILLKYFFYSIFYYKMYMLGILKKST